MALHHLDERVVAAHEAGAAHPADLRVGEGDAAGPVVLGARTVHDRVKRALHLAVRAVAAEHTAVRRARQHHMQAVLHIGVGADRGESGDRALHAPQHQARLRFEQRARIRERAVHRRRGEREEQARLISRLEHGGGGAVRLLLHMAHPVHECVHIAVARQVGGDEPQLRAGAGVRAVGLARPRLDGRAEAVGGGDYGGTAGEQAVDHLRGNRIGCHACHHGHIARVRRGFSARRRGRRIGDLRVSTGQIGTAVFARPLGEPARFGGHGLAERGEVAVEHSLIVVVERTGQVFARACPAVVEEDRLARVEARRHLLGPVGAELGFHRRHDRRIGVFFRRGLRFVEAELAEHEARGLSEHAVGAGHLRGERVERCGIDDRTARGPAGGRLGHGDALLRGDELHGGVDERVRLRHVSRGIGAEFGQVTASRTRAFACAEHERGDDTARPAVAQTPHVAHARLDLRGLDAGGAKEAAHAIAHDVGEHRAERLVIRGDLVDERAECVDARFGRAVDARHAQLGTDVHQ